MQKTALAPFWAMLVKIRLLLILASGHTGGTYLGIFIALQNSRVTCFASQNSS